MQTASEFEREKSELEAILASGIFTRAPSLAHLLTYICSKHFEGCAEQIKEYNIAVEALGRPEGFDQKRDSIVRVEAHRLRKRLRDYYEGEGAGHEIRILLPPGQYAPVFEVQQSTAGELAEVAGDAVHGAAEITESSAPQTIDVSPEHRPRRRLLVWAAPAIALAVSTVLGLWWQGVHARAGAPVRISDSAVRPESAVVSQNTDEIRILAGADKGSYVDGFGRAWESDRFFTGGSVFHVANQVISGTRDPHLYQSRREGAFQYDIPLNRGVYELRLHFAESVYGETNIAGGGETSRIFNVFLNDKPVLEFLDVIADVGPSAADVKVFKDVSPAADGKLHLRFEAVTNVPFLNAIEIAPGLPHRMRPIRIIARDRAYTDKEGRTWEPDRYSKGGQLASRFDHVSGADDPELYRGERFGNLTYAIPVAPGRYAVILHFAEAWFGLNKPGAGGAGNRLFDILCSGVALQRNLDVYRESGGPNRALVKIFHGLEPNHQGYLDVTLVPEKNYAFVNALEVLDESPSL